MSAIERILNTEGWLERLIAGGVQACIQAHGPITSQWAGSAAKRVAGHLRGELTIQVRETTVESEAVVVLQREIGRLDKELAEAKRRNNALARTADHWRLKAQNGK